MQVRRRKENIVSYLSEKNAISTIVWLSITFTRWSSSWFEKLPCLLIEAETSSREWIEMKNHETNTFPRMILILLTFIWNAENNNTDLLYIK